MSIIIKGLDMPKAINEFIAIILYPNGNAHARSNSGQFTYAQAIQIPTPHGRIIDESKGGVINGWIVEAPTILESEE